MIKKLFEFTEWHLEQQYGRNVMIWITPRSFVNTENHALAEGYERLHKH